MAGELFAGKYRLLTKAGRGGMCEVLRARQDGLDRMVAVKWLLPELAATPDVRERFVREANLCSRMRHPNVTRVFEVGEHLGRPFIAMELVEGSTLRELLRSGLPLGRGLELMAQVAEALDHAHGLGIVHRDLKPENVLVDRRGAAKVADWGLARQEAAGDRVTRTGLLIGTPAYMSPEQIRGEEPKVPTDLYALGVMLYELSTGRVPFAGARAVDVMEGHLSGLAPLLESVAPRLPKELGALVAALMAKDPAERPAPAGAVARRLRAIAADPRGSSAMASPASVAVDPLLSSRSGPPRASAAPRRGLAVAGGALVLLSAVVAWWHARSVEGPAPAAPDRSGAPVVRDVAVRAPDRLYVRWAGPKDAAVTLDVLEAGGRGPAPHGRLLVPREGRQQLTRELVGAEVPVDPPLLRAVLVADGSQLTTATFAVDPAKALEEALAPLALDRDRLGRLLAEALRLRSQLGAPGEDAAPVDRAGAEARVAALLVRHGLGPDRLGPLRPLLGAISRDHVLPGSRLAARLFSLLAVEEVLGESAPPLPWLPLTPALETRVTFGRATGPTLPALVPGGRALVHVAPLPGALTLLAGQDPVNPPRVWLAAPGWLRIATTSGFLGESSTVYLSAQGVRVAKAGEFVKAATVRLAVPGDTRPWPPRDAWVALAGVCFGRENHLLVRLNGGPEIPLLNVGFLSPGAALELETGRWFLYARLDPGRLRAGANALDLRVDELPGLTAAYGLGIEAAWLFVGADRRGGGAGP